MKTSLPEDYPSNVQYSKHFLEFLHYGYKAHLGACEVKFPHRERDGSRQILPHSVGIVDGFCKIIIMMSIVSFCKELELSEEDLSHPVLSATLQSFASIHCAYNHFAHPAHHYLYALRNFTCQERIITVFHCFGTVLWIMLIHKKSQNPLGCFLVCFQLSPSSQLRSGICNLGEVGSEPTDHSVRDWAGYRCRTKNDNQPFPGTPQRLFGKGDR